MATPTEAAFIAFGLGSQAVLAAFFAARRWRPGLADRLGWLAYAVAGLGLPPGRWFLAGGQSWRLAWSVFLVLFCVNTALNLAGHFRRQEGRCVSRRG